MGNQVGQGHCGLGACLRCFGFFLSDLEPVKDAKVDEDDIADAEEVGLSGRREVSCSVSVWCRGHARVGETRESFCKTASSHSTAVCRVQAMADEVADRLTPK